MTQETPGTAGSPDQPPVTPSAGPVPTAPPSYGQPPAPGQQPYGAPHGTGQHGTQQYATPPQPLRPEEERQWAMFAHLGGVLGFLPSLIIYLVFKDRGTFVREQSKEALNFQITMLIGYVVAIVLNAALPIWMPLQLLLWVASVIFSIIGWMAASRGENYRYPFALRLVS